MNVQRQVERCGGGTAFGWQIFETAGVLLEAHFHAVWQGADGSLLDVTPERDNEPRILFQSDPVRHYVGRRVRSIRRALHSDSRLDELIRTYEAEADIVDPNIPLFGDQARLLQSEVEAVHHIRNRRAQLMFDVFNAAMSRIGRNDQCACGSGHKHKKCCGRPGAS